MDYQADKYHETLHDALKRHGIKHRDCFVAGKRELYFAHNDEHIAYMNSAEGWELVHELDMRDLFTALNAKLGQEAGR